MYDGSRIWGSQDPTADRTPYPVCRASEVFIEFQQQDEEPVIHGRLAPRPVRTSPLCPFTLMLDNILTGSIIWFPSL